MITQDGDAGVTGMLGGKQLSAIAGGARVQFSALTFRGGGFVKGFVFTEFLDMASDTFSPEVVEQVLDMSDLESEGAYTTVGTYSPAEMNTLVGNLSQVTGIPSRDLVMALGRHLFAQFTVKFPQFLQGHSTVMEFLPRVDSYVHLEVRKLYPDAELPQFDCVALDPDTMQMTYRSSRHLADLAEGLLEGCGHHFGEDFAIERTPDPDDPDTVVFTLARRSSDG